MVSTTKSKRKMSTAKKVGLGIAGLLGIAGTGYGLYRGLLARKRSKNIKQVEAELNKAVQAGLISKEDADEELREIKETINAASWKEINEVQKNAANMTQAGGRKKTRSRITKRKRVTIKKRTTKRKTK